MSDTRWRRSMPPVLRPLRDPALALLWGGLATSSIGDQLFTVALAWIAIQVLGPSAGYLAVLQYGCVVAVALLGGRWADRIAHRRLMIAADLARAATLVVVTVSWLARGLPPAPMLVLAVAVLGAGQALFVPALQASVPALVRDRTALPAANALLDTTARIARLLGPGAVAMLGALIPLVHFVSIDALTFVASACAVAATIRIRRLPPLDAPLPESVWRSLARGFRVTSGHPLLGYALFATSVASGVWYAVLFLGVPLVLGQARAGVGSYGWVLVGYGMTNLLATLVVGGFPVPRRPAFMMFGGTFVLGLGLAGIGLAGLLPPPQRPVAFFVAAAFAAIGGPLEDIPIAVLRQTRLAAADQPAAARAYLVAGCGGILVALGAAPLLFVRLGTAPCMMAGGLLAAMVGGFGWLRYAGTPG